MKGITVLALASFVSFTAATGEALAQSAKSLVGAWTLVDVGDVYGKSVPAAIFMAISRTLLKARALEGGAVGEGDAFLGGHRLNSCQN